MTAEKNGNGKLSGWISTAVGVLGFIASGLVVFAARLDFVDNDLRDQVIELREENARLEERVDGVLEALVRQRSSISDLDATLQREMRILDDTASTRVNEMDKRLQQEMRHLIDTIEEQIRALERVVFGKGE